MSPVIRVRILQSYFSVRVIESTATGGKEGVQFQEALNAKLKQITIYISTMIRHLNLSGNNPISTLSEDLSKIPEYRR